MRLEPLERRLLLALEREAFLPPGAPGLAAACSGGPDSTALVLALARLFRGPLAGKMLAVLHLNHGLRGAAADGDEEFVRELCRRLELPFAAGREDVAALAGGAGIEEAAREARYRFFAAALARLGLEAVALGHTADDQAETVLHHLLRGAGWRGLAGMPARRRFGPGGARLLLRPLLGLGRAEVLAYLAARGQDYRTDATNFAPVSLRNRLRAEVFPLLESLAPGAKRRLAAAAARLAGLEQWARAELDRLAAGLELRAEEAGQVLALDAAGLGALPGAVGRLLLDELCRRLGGALPDGAAGAEALALARHGPSGRRLPLGGGLVAEREFARFILHRPAPASPFCLPLPVPGEALLPGGGRVRAALCGVPPAAQWRLPPAGTEFLDADRAPAALEARSRRPGDALRPLGAPGRRKLKQILNERRVPRRRRDLLPVVAGAGGGPILCLPGVALAAEAALTAASRRALAIVLEPA